MSVVFGLGFMVLALACGGWTQPAECKNYVACFVKVGGLQSDVDGTYGEKGTCWITGGTTAEQCAMRCKESNAAYRETGLAADGGCTFD